MDCKPPITQEEFNRLESNNDKLSILFGMQTLTMDCLNNLNAETKKRRLFDKTAIVVGGVVGGFFGALFEKIGFGKLQ